MDDGGLINAYLLDGHGGGEEVGWEAVKAWRPGQGTLWVHLDRRADDAGLWVRESSGIDDVTATALLADETRPRTFSTAQGLLVILRGVNLNPGAHPEDMVSLRVFIDGDRIITFRHRRLMGIADIAAEIQVGKGPRTPGDFLAAVADRLVARMEPVLDDLGETADTLETSLATLSPPSIRQLRELRHTAILLKRYLTPQRDIVSRLQSEPFSGLSVANKLELREVGNRMTRYVEELEEIRERAAVLQDELLNRLSDTANRTVYVLTVVAAVMLPPSFFTGLLGMNVGGMPGVDAELGFWVVCLALLAFGLFEIWLFRRLKWI